MLASMSEIDPRAEMPLVDWSELSVSGLLPTGTVTLLLADVEGSTRLWETQPKEMTTALARLNQTVSAIIASHDGVRPVEQGEGDSFVAAFARASDAVAAALELQRAPLAPIRLRIGLHTGEIQLRDEGNYAGPTINRTARLRDLGHGGQTLLSGATEAMVLDALPSDAWLSDLGTHALRDLPRPERVVQLCHPDVVNEFPALRVSKAIISQRLPVQLTSFVGRQEQLTQVRELLTQNRLVTLTGAGGAGKTRLAVQIAGQLSGEFGDGIWYVDLAPITDPDLVPITAARAFGLPDQPGRSTIDTVTRFIVDRQMMVVLDNCEHLLDASAELVIALLGGSPGLTVLATSREPIGVAGEATWRVPSLSIAGEAVELFAERARLAQTGFTVTDDCAALVAEICQRLDGMPLAIELAAARVRALSLLEILDSLHDRFRLLTGGARTAVRRQQTLRASVDWSHALLTETERMLFRGLAVFFGGFDLAAAQTVAGSGVVERYQVLDQLTLLVDKSLLVADDCGGRTRYRLLETVRQYAAEKLVESGEADTVRARHRDHYTALAALLDAPADGKYDQRLQQAEIEIDNLRAAFGWSRENFDTRAGTGARVFAAAIVADAGPSSGKGWPGSTPPSPTKLPRNPPWRPRCMRGPSRTRRSSMHGAPSTAACTRPNKPWRSRARSTSRPCWPGHWPPAALSPLRAITPRWPGHASPRRSAWPVQWTIGGASASSSRCRPRASTSRVMRARRARRRRKGATSPTQSVMGSTRVCVAFCLGGAQLVRGDLAGATAQLREVAAEAEAAHDEILRVASLSFHTLALAYRGEAAAARAASDAAVAGGAELGGRAAVLGQLVLVSAALADGDGRAAREASDRQMTIGGDAYAPLRRIWNAEAALADRDLVAARRWADEAVSITTGWYSALALAIRARVAIAAGESERAECDAHNALAIAAECEAYLSIPDILECLAALAGQAGSHQEAARLFGAAHGIRQRMGSVRFKVWDADYEASIAALRDTLGEKDFNSAWAEGAALSVEEAIAYAQRGRGERKRPASGWASLTPTELDVVGLVSEGLANNDIATRLFVSPRTVQTHLTHVYTKLGLTSRVQLAQEAARHN